ncbi:MAG: hypothetical protein WCP16_17600 [Pseudanabaena sp. ELA645]|jgi:hypothetical protein
MNKFNRILLASGLAATASLMANSAAFAGTSGTVTVTGNVASIMSMTVTASDSSASLELIPGTDYSNVKIATLTGVSTNGAGGLKVSASSNWVLTSGSDTIPITKIGDSLTSASTATTKATPSTSVASILNITKSTAGGNADSSNVYIDYSVSSTQAKGTYTGSITFTATDN